MKFKYIFVLLAIFLSDITNLYAIINENERFWTFYEKYIYVINDRKTSKNEVLNELSAFLKSSNIQIKIFSTYLRAICLASPQDNFESAVRSLKEINKLVEKLSVDTKRSIIENYFRRQPLVNIKALTKINEIAVRNLKKQNNNELVIGFSNYFFNLAKLFYKLSTPTENCGNVPCLNDLFYEVSINNATLNRYFYNSIPELRQNSEQMKLWYIDIFKHVPDK